MKRTARNIEKGKKYFFAVDDFAYPRLFVGFIQEHRVYRIIDGEFSTKNIGDRYEVKRVYGFDTEEEARKELLRRIKDRMKSIKKEYKEAIKLLTIPI